MSDDNGEEFKRSPLDREINLVFAKNDEAQTGKDFQSLEIKGFFGLFFLSYLFRRNDLGSYDVTVEGTDFSDTDSPEKIKEEYSSIETKEALAYLDQFAHEVDNIKINGKTLPSDKADRFVRNVALANGFECGEGSQHSLKQSFQVADTSFAASNAVNKLFWDLKHAEPLVSEPFGKEDKRSFIGKLFLPKGKIYSHAPQRVAILEEFCRNYRLDENLKQSLIEMIEQQDSSEVYKFMANTNNINVQEYDRIGDEIGDQNIRACRQLVFSGFTRF